MNYPDLVEPSRAERVRTCGPSKARNLLNFLDAFKAGGGGMASQPDFVPPHDWEDKNGRPLHLTCQEDSA
jgi:hypothetical protein